MSSLISGVASYLPFRKSTPAELSEPVSEEKTVEGTESTDKDVSQEDTTSQEEQSKLLSDKKTDEVIDPSQQPGFLRRLGTGVYSVTTGTIGAGVGGVKWVAGKSYDAGAVVVGGTKAVISKVPVPTIKKKDKKE